MSKGEKRERCTCDTHVCFHGSIQSYACNCSCFKVCQDYILESRRIQDIRSHYELIRKRKRRQSEGRPGKERTGELCIGLVVILEVTLG